jgi:hypothetical protein
MNDLLPKVVAPPVPAPAKPAAKPERKTAISALNIRAIDWPQLFWQGAGTIGVSVVLGGSLRSLATTPAGISLLLYAQIFAGSCALIVYTCREFFGLRMGNLPSVMLWLMACGAFGTALALAEVQ